MPTIRVQALLDAWDDLGLSVDAFWTSYVSIGGDRLPASIGDLRAGTWDPSRREYNFLAQALNDVYVARGDNHPVPYWDA